jgi:Cd2+/Zn2+-exporting ATPase/Cu+-exporting ATPase
MSDHIDASARQPIIPVSADQTHLREAHDRDEHHDHAFEWQDAARIALVALSAALVWFRVWEPLPNISVIGVLGMFIGIYPILREAIHNIVQRRMTMELSMTIAILAAVAIGEFFTALVIVLFVLIAEVLEGLTVCRGRIAIKDLLDLLPNRILVRTGEDYEEIERSTLRVGHVVLVKPGGRIPADGIVIHGSSSVDQSAITGESMPIDKLPGSEVFAGTINQSGVLKFEVKSIGRDTAFGRIIDVVERAEHSKAPIQKTADRLAGYLVYFALACALLTFFLTHNLRSTISVIIVAGACGIAAGTPLAILGAIGRSAKLGTIVKGGIYMEELAKIDTVVLDKTGTATFGKPTVSDIQPFDGMSDDELLGVAGSAERGSDHPVALAILGTANALRITLREPDQFEYIAGKGIVCRVNGRQVLAGTRALLDDWRVPVTYSPRIGEDSAAVWIARDRKVLGVISVSDTIRPSAQQAILRLRELGLRTLLLTGDRERPARIIARQLRVDEVKSDMLPEEKLTVIQDLIADGHRVAMIGDGINDAPALTQATVGVAMGSGTDLARESADVLLLGNDLSRFVDTLAVARRCQRIIMTNFAGTLLVDAVGVGLAAFGVLNPLLAAFIHVSSELAFILNSARLLPRVRTP